MEYDIKSSIQKFESKQDFRAVKLMTRKSFREDQHALNKRLSLRQNQRLVNKMDSDDKLPVNGDANSNALAPKFGELTVTSTQEQPNRTDYVEYINNGYVSDVGDVTLDMTLMEEEEIAIPKQFVREFRGRNVVSAGQSVAVTVNGDTNYTNDNSNKESSDGDPLPSGEFLVRRPTIRDQPRACTTPEPRLKASGHIYKKNEKLTSSSTHWEKMTDREGPVRADVQYSAVPIVPGKEVPFLPANGSLRSFTVEQMVSIFRHLGVPENIVFHLSYSKIDGNKFSALTDAQLDELGIRNSVICYFRDRSGSVAIYKRKPKFML